MTVVNYSVQETFGDNVFVWSGRALVRAGAALRPLPRRAGAQPPLHRASSSLIEVPLGLSIALAMPRKGPWVSVCLVLMALPLLIPWNVVGAMWNIMALPEIGLLGKTMNSLGIPFNYTREPGRRLVRHRADGRLALDLAGRAALLRRPRLDPRRLLPGRQDRRRPALGGVPLHPAAEAALRADDRRSCCASWTRS